jgi:hypothetical protein
MSLLTPWGYTLVDLSTLSSIITTENFNTATANKYATDSRVASALQSASQSVRDFCGWHLAPSTLCEFSTTFFDRRVTRVNGDLLVQLPARFVSAITSLKIDGNDCTTFVLEHNGILRIYDAPGGLYPYSPIVIKYTAGLPDTLSVSLQAVVVNRAVKILTANNGVQSETAGGVSISYNAQWVNDALASGLSSTEEAALAPYKLRGVF